MDIDAGIKIARRIKAGSFMINNSIQSGGCFTLPFGGDGKSGVDRLQGEQSYFKYVASKSLVICPKSAADLWMPIGTDGDKAVWGLVKLFNGRSVGERISGLLSFLRFKPKGIKYS